MFNKYTDLYLEMTNKKRSDLTPVPINEKYIVKVERDTVKGKVKLKETIDVIFYDLNKNVLTNPKKITVNRNKVLKAALIVSLKDNLVNQVANMNINLNKFKYLQIFINGVDYYGLLKIDNHDKIFENIAHTIAIGTPIYKNF
jgi:hypothetical protein